MTALRFLTADLRLLWALFLATCERACEHDPGDDWSEI